MELRMEREVAKALEIRKKELSQGVINKQGPVYVPEPVDYGLLGP